MNPSPHPAISIIIPNYNYGHFLPTCIESILSQGYTNYELIIVDDGSTDDSPQLISEYATRYRCIHPILCAKNRGMFLASEEGIKAARGEYLHFFSADDRYLPHFLQRVMDFACSYPMVNIICSEMSYFANAGNATRETAKLLTFDKPLYIPPEAAIPLFRKASFARPGFGLPGLSCVLKKEVLTYYGWLDPSLENISDWFFFNQIALQEGFGYIPEILITMREHSDTYTSRIKRDKVRRRATYDHLLEKLAPITQSKLRRRFIAAGLLDFIFKERYWHLFTHSCYHPFWSALITYRLERWHRSFNRCIVENETLEHGCAPSRLIDRK